ncbi:MAG: HAD-IA family hydrolase [Planctomycetaceae bacterium]|nr:HAD-IA family hydrolase [Planctomycetaceae bacterium]MCB9952938.1 HAD-IA family hydrolase [Planctomycetaceae bacterium]
MTLIRAVVFDMDGIMFNTEDLFHLTGHELMRRRGKVATPELFHAMMGRRAHDAFTAMINMMQLTETIPELQEESEAIFDDLLSKHLDTMPGLHELLDTIEQQNIPKGVATSSDRRYLERLLNQFDLLPRFDMTLTAEDVTQGKPHPEIYLTAASRLGVDPHEMLVLEDSENGTKAAAAAGAHIVSVPHDHSRHHDFSVAKAVVPQLNHDYVMNLLSQKS